MAKINSKILLIICSKVEILINFNLLDLKKVFLISNNIWINYKKYKKIDLDIILNLI